MYKIARNANNRNFELVRNRDGRVMDSQPIDNCSHFYHMAYFMSAKQPHAAGILWRAAETAAAGRVELLSQFSYQVESEGYSKRVAIINNYEIRHYQRERETVAAPQPAPIYTCSCKFYTEGRGTRPIVANMPTCKHILAGMMVRQMEIGPKYWQEITEQQQRGRDSYGRVKQQREAEAEKMHEDAIINNAKGKARRATLNAKMKQWEAEGAATAQRWQEQEQPF
jgi:hypothetical protein